MTKAINKDFKVLIIGAGPSGCIAGALLKNKGYQVTILERQLFPRFSIGESLLPQCMEFIKQAGMLEAVINEGFQFKNGASFVRRDQHTEFSFENKFGEGVGTTFQVQRGRFDQVLANEAIRLGVDIQWQMEVIDTNLTIDKPEIIARTITGEIIIYQADFVLDASGFGRILPKLLNLELPSSFPVRQALFCHIEDKIDDASFDRNKIRVTVHPEHKDVWYWLIPFSNGRSSLGVVAETSFFENEFTNKQALLEFISQDIGLHTLLKNAVFDEEANTIIGYAANVKSLYGKNYALLGNAAEFLDPVFSSGVTIAMKSACLAANILDRQFNNEEVDWDKEYAIPLQQGVDTFRVYVEAWYDGRFQDVIFNNKDQPKIKKMISSVLAGYAWDLENPYVKNARLKFDALATLCRLD